MANHPAIIVTRPSGQARRLMELIQEGSKTHAIKVNVIGLPLLTIVPKTDSKIDAHWTSALSQAKLIIFVSPNAIECAMRLIADAGMIWGDLVNPKALIGVVGASSRDALVRHGVESHTIVIPASVSQSDSEGLWQILQARVQSWQSLPVVIFKGDGGRESLIDHLQAAGASVEALAIYTRIPLDASSNQWQQLDGLDAQQTLWLLSSSEAVRHLGEMAQTQTSLQPLIQGGALCSHPHIAKTAKEIGFTQVSLSDPGDESIANAALAWLRGQVKKSP